MYDRDTFLIHKERPGQVGALLKEERTWHPDEHVLTLWEGEDGKQEVCYSRIRFLQPFDWRECLECGHQGQCRPGYWNCSECECGLHGYKGWALAPSPYADPREPPKPHVRK